MAPSRTELLLRDTPTPQVYLTTLSDPKPKQILVSAVEENPFIRHLQEKLENQMTSPSHTGEETSINAGLDSRANVLHRGSALHARNESGSSYAGVKRKADVNDPHSIQQRTAQQHYNPW
ncbi:hypothetical protein BASA81_015346 [Batrachochytrium salamandrivorans]|nr:hypothetical protein BASA81_015346 [Batrachochytrium salamandrivorans]